MAQIRAFSILAMAIFGPFLAFCFGPLGLDSSISYFGHFWAFLHIHKAFYKQEKIAICFAFYIFHNLILLNINLEIHIIADSLKKKSQPIIDS